MTYTEPEYLIRAMINPDDNSKSGIEAKIEVTIIEGKKRSYRRIPTGSRIPHADSWSYATERVKKSHPNANLLNSAIELKYNNVSRYLSNQKEREYLLSIDPDLGVLKKYYPLSDEMKLIEYVQEFIEQRQAVKKKTGSVKDFITLKGRLKRFEEVKGKRYIFDDINLNYSRDLIQWLIKHHHGNTAIKTVESLISVLTYFYDRRTEYGINVPDVFKQKNFKQGLPKKIEARPLPLEEDEFRKLYISTLEIDSDERLKKLRDRFLIQSTCGFRDSDLYTIRPSNKINNYLIKYSPTKTQEYKVKNEILLPLNRYAYELLNEYNFDTSSLKISNQKYNDGLKELFKLLGFNKELDIRDYVNSSDYSKFEKRFDLDFEKNGYYVEKWMLLSSHNGRDTFFTRAIESGIDIKNLMEFTGQTKFEMMRKYVNTATDYKIKMMGRFDKFYSESSEWRKERDIINYKNDPVEVVRMYKEIFGNETDIDKEL